MVRGWFAGSLVVLSACGLTQGDAGGDSTDSDGPDTAAAASGGLTGADASGADDVSTGTPQPVDPDGDGVPFPADNCPDTPNPMQQDGDGDGIGDECDCGDASCDCGPGAPDTDADGVPDACDNCPVVANNDPAQDTVLQGTVLSDWDGDGMGNVCDECPYTTGVFAGNCCDPRLTVEEEIALCKFRNDSISQLWCQPILDGSTFQCIGHGYLNSDIWEYGTYPLNKDAPIAPPGALFPPGDADCNKIQCSSQWCKIGDNVPCGPGNQCIAWHLPGEAPPELTTLGACARTDSGPCVGKVGRQCMTWLDKSP